jgi:hypothetical protein
MAIRVTRWSPIKIIFFILDSIILILNILLFLINFYLIYSEFYSRGSLKLFIFPFLISIFNIIIDLFMNKINIEMKYAGHNRYGMIIRFFMFYCLLTLIIYSDQRIKYVIKDNNDIKFMSSLLGEINIGLLVFSMILSFCVIDVENFGLIAVKKKRKRRNEPEEMNMMMQENLVPPDL